MFPDITWTSGRRQTLPNRVLPSTFSKVPGHTSSFQGLYIVSLPKFVPVHLDGRQSDQRLREIHRASKNILSFRPSSPGMSKLWSGMYSRILTDSTTRYIQSHGGRRGGSTGHGGIPPDRHLAN